MDDGSPCNDTLGTTSSSAVDANWSRDQALSEQLSVLSMSREEESSAQGNEAGKEKDPRKIARKYQEDLCKKALEENIIVYLGTGCGKTHIAVLLIYEMGHLIRKPQNNVCVFLAPTVALVQQQAKVIEDSIDFKVGTYCGSSKRLTGHHDWQKQMEHYEVLVMTPQVLLQNLSHCLIRMEHIALLIFDECHYAQLESSHPYAEIMKVFYKRDSAKLPRIFGMTASPKMGRGTSINGLEAILHSKVYSVEDKGELEQFVTSPKVNVYYYSSSHPPAIYFSELAELRQKCVAMLGSSCDDLSSIRSIKKMLHKVHGNLVFCLESLGIWGAFQASNILIRGDQSERSELIEAETSDSDALKCDKYLIQASSLFASICMEASGGADLSCVKVLKEPFFSKKLLRLIGILSNFRFRPNMKCIIFVNRIITARSLSYILQNLEVLRFWKCDFLVGVHSGLKSMSRKNTNSILDKFRSDQLNLLVATKVGEEGLDIQTCGLVIRFDLPETVASFIQSRGRARMPQSEYAFLVDSGNQRERNLIEHFKKDEDRMNEEIVSRTSSTELAEFKLSSYDVDSTGATISCGQSISLLHRYCSKLPHDEYFKPKPSFCYFDDPGGTVCCLILPSNAPIRQILSAPQSSIEAAKKDACLKACEELHKVGVLNDYLLPDQDDVNVESSHDFSELDSSDELDLQRELHEMLVPSILKERWTSEENHVFLHSYLVKFLPNPVDRNYRDFALFLNAPLPAEAEKMKLDLHLTHGRCVRTELVLSRLAKFNKEERVLAEKFQEMLLKVILDRAQFVSEYVVLGQNNFNYSRSAKFYLLLPIILDESEETFNVDWICIRRCLFSPIFRGQDDTICKGLPDLNYLQLANGPKSVSDVVNSLIYLPCKNSFFFVADVVTERNGYSSYNESKNHVQHYIDMFDMCLSYPEQPLLKGKQVFNLDNLLRKKGNSESREKTEHFVELPPEICQLKVIGFSKDIGSSLSLLPSIMHRLESLLVAIELKERLSDSFPEAKEVTAHRILEAITTANCNELFSLERLEVLGDAFLKFAVGRHLFLVHDALDEGQLTRKRSNLVSNLNLFKLATKRNLQVYIRNQSFDPTQYFAPGRPCSVVCSKEAGTQTHSLDGQNEQVICDQCHQWLNMKTIADVVEALVGAFIVDSGFRAATAFLRWIGIRVDFEESQVSKICSASSTFLPLGAQNNIAVLENLLGYTFVHKGLLVQAFVHPSYNDHWGGCYQRLEFLGDAVLDYLITSYLYSAYRELNPGLFTDLRSALVNNISFADIAASRSLHKFILCDSSSLREAMDTYVDFIGKSASDNGQVEGPKCPKALGDLVESCAGAVLLDTGFDLRSVWVLMLSFLDPVMHLSRFQINPIRLLQELCQSFHWHLHYTATKKGGKFLVEARVIRDNVSATVSATNISGKVAKKVASQYMLARLKAEGYKPKAISPKDVLKSLSKTEGKLIGFDEMPTNVRIPGSTGSAVFKIREPSTSDCEQNVFSTNDPSMICNPSQRPKRQSTIERNHRRSEQEKSGNFCQGSAKSQLYEICDANCWKSPLFECCKEEGPSHLREFTFKVVVEIEEASNTILECYGEPRLKKKDAAENAAEGAIWYLKHQGYLQNIK